MSGYIEWSGMTGKDARGNVYKIQDKSRPGDPWFTVYLIPPASSWAGGVVEPMASRDSVRGAKDYAEQTAARMSAQQNPRRKKNPPSTTKAYALDQVYTWAYALANAGLQGRDGTTSKNNLAEGRKVAARRGASSDEIKDTEQRAIAQAFSDHAARPKKNPLTAGLGGTYIVTHANPRSAPSKSVKLRFPSSSAAWEGMRKLDDAGIDAGYPSFGPATSGPHKGYYTVQVGRKNAAAAQRVLGGARSNPSALNLEATLEAQRAVKDAERVVNQANLNYFGDPTELLADIQAANVAVQKAQRLAKASGVAHLNKTVRVLAKRVKELREHALREARGAF